MKYALAFALTLAAAPAFAHTGDHGGLSLMQAAAHMFEADHIIFALLSAGIGVLAYKAGRKAAMRDMSSEARHDPR